MRFLLCWCWHSTSVTLVKIILGTLLLVVSSPMAFGNSWKVETPPCSDVTVEMFPCDRNSYCSAWAQRRCMIITADIFKECHLKVWFFYISSHSCKFVEKDAKMYIYIYINGDQQPLHMLMKALFCWMICDPQVDPGPYYHACVQESCSCEFEGKFLGFCTAVAAYAEACSDQDVCVKWRTPDLCRKWGSTQY